MQNTEKRINYSYQMKAAVMVLLVIGVIITAIWAMDTENTQTQVDERDILQVYEITSLDARTDVAEAISIDLNTATTQTVITEGGDYILSGETKYAVHVDAQDQIVHLCLNGVDIRSTSGPAIQVDTAGKVVITLIEDTENILRDTGNYNEYKESDAALYSEVDLTINGTGALAVYGAYKDGIHTKDLLKILEGNIYIQAKRDGIRGNDGIVLTPAEMTIKSEGNGIRTTNAKKEGKGSVKVLGGNYIITAEKYAIISEADLHVRKCKMECVSGVANLDIKGSIDLEEGCIQE